MRCGSAVPAELRHVLRATRGSRGQATDRAPEFAQDARVLNRLSSHTESSTRERIYQDQQNVLVRARAAKAWRGA